MIPNFKWIEFMQFTLYGTVTAGDIVYMDSNQKILLYPANGAVAIGVVLQSGVAADVVTVRFFAPVRCFLMPITNTTYDDLNTGVDSSGVKLTADNSTLVYSTAAQRLALIGSCFPLVGITGGQAIDLDSVGSTSAAPFKLMDFEFDSYSGRYNGWFTFINWIDGGSNAVGNQNGINVT